MYFEYQGHALGTGHTRRQGHALGTRMSDSRDTLQWQVTVVHIINSSPL